MEWKCSLPFGRKTAQGKKELLVNSNWGYWYLGVGRYEIFFPSIFWCRMCGGGGRWCGGACTRVFTTTLQGGWAHTIKRDVSLPYSTQSECNREWQKEVREKRGWLQKQRGLKCLLLKWTFWCKSEEWFVKEMSRGLKKACALKAKKGKPVYNPLNDLKVTKNPTFKSFSESFYIYTVKTCRSLVRGFYFTAPVLPDSNVLHVSRKKTHPASFKHQAPTCQLRSLWT